MGGTAAPVFFQLPRVRLNGFAGDELRLGFAAADADRELRRAGAGSGPAAELVLYQPVFQRVECDDTQPPARGKMLKNGVQPLLQSVQLMVDRNAQRLERAPRGVFVLRRSAGGMALATISAS